jgi:hypothetical protein
MPYVHWGSSRSAHLAKSDDRILIFLRIAADS